MVRETGSTRRARRWLAEMRADAARAGRSLDAGTMALFEHLMDCGDCELRENSDPDLCEEADEIMDADAGVGA